MIGSICGGVRRRSSGALSGHKAPDGAINPASLSCRPTTRAGIGLKIEPASAAAGVTMTEIAAMYPRKCALRIPSGAIIHTRGNRSCKLLQVNTLISNGENLPIDRSISKCRMGLWSPLKPVQPAVPLLACTPPERAIDTACRLRSMRGIRAHQDLSTPMSGRITQHVKTPSLRIIRPTSLIPYHLPLRSCSLRQPRADRSYHLCRTPATAPVRSAPSFPTPSAANPAPIPVLRGQDADILPDSRLATKIALPADTTSLPLQS
jgi:hypothetical protein